MNSTPNYYAVIPANVRYSEVSHGAKLLFGEISALSNGKGYCWASNAYFATLYNVHTDTISDWISQLYNQGFIKIENGKGKNRKITMSVKTPRLPVQPRQKHRTNLGENTEQNNTFNNSVSKDTQRQVVTRYSELYQKAFNYKPKIESKHYALLTRRLKEDGPEVVKAAIDYYFESDKRGRERLSPSGDLIVLLSATIFNKITSEMPRVETTEQRLLREQRQIKLKNCPTCQGKGGYLRDSRWVICEHE